MAWSNEDITSLRIANVSDDERATVLELLAKWNDRLSRNVKRSLYYDTEQAFKDLGIALPPQLRKAKFVLGWATQAVRKPALRSQFDGLRLPGSDDPFELGEVLARNNFSLEFGQSIVSAYTHGVSLVTVAKGAVGEAPVQIQAHSAESSSALWDRRMRRVSAAMTISEVGKDEKPVEFIAYLPHVVLSCAFTPGSGWVAERHANPSGRAQAVAITNDPQTRRPFGRSRLTNAVMGLNDMAVRAYVRMEGNAEVYSSPQLALLGVDEEAFGGEIPESQKFKLAQDRFLALTKDQDGDKPVLQQLQQATMTPHSDMLRTVAAAFSGETGIPPSSLGIIHDQPASAEAIRAAENDMLIDATYQKQMVLTPAVRDIATLAIMVRDDLTEQPEEAWRLSARFADPEFRSMSAQADGVQKIATDMDKIVEYPVLLESVFDDAQVERIQEDQRAANGRMVAQLLAARAAPADGAVGAPGGVDEAQELKAKFDALGVAVRAGVDPDDAASRLGLEGVKFTGAVPVSLRMPESEVGMLEDR